MLLVIIEVDSRGDRWNMIRKMLHKHDSGRWGMKSFSNTVVKTENESLILTPYHSGQSGYIAKTNNPPKEKLKIARCFLAHCHGLK
jgi:hypothetical protein